MGMRTTHAPAANRSFASILRLAALAVGPAASLSVFNQKVAPILGSDSPLGVAILVLLWSPVFFGIPALLTQRERDGLLPTTGGPVASVRRGLKLLPAMLARSSGIRAEVLVSMAAWVVLIVTTADSLKLAVSMLG